MSRLFVYGLSIIFALLAAPSHASFVHTDWKAAGDKNSLLDKGTFILLGFALMCLGRKTKPV